MVFPSCYISGTTAAMTLNFAMNTSCLTHKEFLATLMGAHLQLRSEIAVFLTLAAHCWEKEAYYIMLRRPKLPANQVEALETLE